jgi:RHS repeat-associated protein
MWTPNVNLGTGSEILTWDTTGHKQYELDNQLGNVLETITDKRLQNGSPPNYYTADAATAQDYYPFGMLMPGRQYTFGADSTYRYGFNGKENDNEVYGLGNWQDYGDRFYNPQIGRFPSVDPLFKNYPWYSSYQFAGNTPVQAVDIDGKEPRNLMTAAIMVAPSEPALKKLKSTDYNFWKDMLTFEKTYSFRDLIDGNANIRRQEMDKASGSELNTDYYAAIITKLPPGMTQHQLYEHIRQNFNNFMDYQVATFGTQDPSSKKLWNSSNPTGAVMTFYNPLDNAGVVTSKAGKDYWVFTPVWTTDDHRHPLAGHREFGLTDNGNNTFTFYTRGVDRLWTPADAMYNFIMSPMLRLEGDNFFRQANELWNAVMDNAVKYINDNGGSASKTTSFSRRIIWNNDVKAEDKQ